MPRIANAVDLLCGLTDPPPPSMAQVFSHSSWLSTEDGHVAPLPIRASEPGFWTEQLVKCLTVTSRE